MAPGEHYGALAALGMCRRHIATLWAASHDCEMYCIAGTNLLTHVLNLLPESQLELVRDQALQSNALLLTHCADRDLDFCDDQTVKYARAVRITATKLLRWKLKPKGHGGGEGKDGKGGEGGEGGEDKDGGRVGGGMDEKAPPTKRVGVAGRLGERLKDLDVKLDDVGRLFEELWGDEGGGGGWEED